MVRAEALARSVLQRAARFGSWTIFAVALFIRGANWLWMGTRISPDGMSYLGTCGAWAADPVATLQGWIGIETASFTIPMCAVVEWAGWGVTGWILLQVVLAAVGCALLFATLRILANERAAWVGGLGLAVLWEVAQWDAYLLTETLFVFYLTLGLWCFARLRDAPSRGREWAFYGALALLALVRGIGFLVALGWMVGHVAHRLRASEPATRRRAIVVGLCALVLVSIGLGLSGRLEDITQRGELARIWSAGYVVHDDPTWDHVYEPRPADSTLGFLLVNLDHVLILALLKALVLFLPFAPRFSTIHILLNVATLVPLFLLGGLGLARAARTRGLLLWPWVVPIGAVLFHVCLTFIDYDWRYRIPLLPSFVGLAAWWLSVQPLATSAWERVAAWVRQGPAAAASPDVPPAVEA